ncbi:MAG: hypothetical protein P4L46_15195 [Fimbriimonas sp.]|nr:hypothetical protein [Fimbriimonas sp.]
MTLIQTSLKQRRLFVQDPKKPFRYMKGVEIEGEPYQVLIELLTCGNPPPDEPSSRTP